MKRPIESGRMFAFSAMLVMLLLLAACGKTAMPSAAEDYVGRDHGLVKSELERAGFKDIEEVPIEDLTSERIREDGAVESVSVNGKSDFTTSSKFSASAKVVITYHVLPKVVFPLKADEISASTADELAGKLTAAGYTNVETEILKDLDPDETESPFENEIKIDGKKIPHEGEEIPFDAAIMVTGHYPYEKFDVKLHVDYESNILFGRYVIDVTVDGEKAAELKNGEERSLELRLKEGEHVLVFAKTGDTSVKGETTFTVEESCEVSYRIKSHTNYIDVNDTDVSGETELTETPEVTETPEMTGTPEVTGTPEATEMPEATEIPEPAEGPTPSAVDLPKIP